MKHPLSYRYAMAALVLLLVGSSFFLLGNHEAPSQTDGSKVAVALPKQQMPINQIFFSEDSDKTVSNDKEVSSILKAKQEEPKNLGQIKLSEKVSLGSLISQVYGSDRKSYRKQLLIKNPGMNTFEMLQAGMQIYFPSILQTPGNAFKGMFWLELASYSTLQDACDALHKKQNTNLPVTLLASFTAAKGLRFSIVMKRVFINEKIALDMLQSFPESLRSKTKIVRSWGEHAILYTTPDAWPHETTHSAVVQKYSGSPS